MDAGSDYFPQIMRRHVRRHPDGNPGRSVDKQIGKASWQNDWFADAAIVIWSHVDRLKLQFLNLVFG